MNRFAEDANYWDTTVSPAKSQGEIHELLEQFGTDTVSFTTGQAGGRYAWLIRFQYLGKNYRFVFVPLECKFPLETRSFGGKRRTHLEQSRYQMGRIAAWFIKAILTAAEVQPAALFGFLELPAAASHPGGIPYTASEVDISILASATPLLPSEIFEEGTQ